MSKKSKDRLRDPALYMYYVEVILVRSWAHQHSGLDRGEKSPQENYSAFAGTLYSIVSLLSPLLLPLLLQPPGCERGCLRR